MFLSLPEKTLSGKNNSVVDSGLIMKIVFSYAMLLQISLRLQIMMLPRLPTLSTTASTKYFENLLVRLGHHAIAV